MARTDFKFHLEWQSIILDLPDESRLRCFDAVIRYAQDGTIPELDSMGMAVFKLIKNDIDADTKRREEVSLARSKAGKKHKGNQYEKNGTNVPTNGTNVPNENTASPTSPMNTAIDGGLENGTNVPTNGTNVPNTENDTLAHADNNHARPQIDSYTEELNNNDNYKPKRNTTPKGVCKEKGSDAAKAATPIQERKNNFYSSLVPYVDKYGKSMVREFYDYWSEMNRSETKMRFELQKTWEVGKRLATWANKEPIRDKKQSGMSVGVVLNERPKYTKGW